VKGVERFYEKAGFSERDLDPAFYPG